MTCTSPASLSSCVCGLVSNSWNPWPEFLTYSRTAEKCVSIACVPLDPSGQLSATSDVTTLTGLCSRPVEHKPPHVDACTAEFAADSPSFAYFHSESLGTS